MCESSSSPPPSDPLIMINAFYSDGGKALLLIPQRWCHKRCWVCLSVFMPVHSWNYYKINSIHFSRKPFKNTIEAFMVPKLVWGLPLFLLPASSILNILCSVCPLHLLLHMHTCPSQPLSPKRSTRASTLLCVHFWSHPPSSEILTASVLPPVFFVTDLQTQSWLRELSGKAHGGHELLVMIEGDCGYCFSLCRWDEDSDQIHCC